MTVSCERLAKRTAVDEASGTVHSLKKMRVLEPLQSAQRVASGPVAANGHEMSVLLNNSAKGLKKRSRLDGLLQEVSCTSPPAGKRGKLLDGSNSSVMSPHATVAALEEQLTCEGLEKDLDLEVQHAYISSQLRQREARQATLQQQVSSSASRVSAETPVAVAARAAAAADGDVHQEKDAPRSSGSRDQAQHHRSSRDQMQQYRDRPPVEITPERVRSPTPGGDDEDDEERVVLHIETDKEWQRLFAVLTLENAPRSASKCEQQHTPTAHQRSSRAWDSRGAAAAPGAAAAAAPTTPTRSESEHQAAAETVTPTRRSFLATEFSRVHARMTPEREHSSNRHASAMEMLC